MIQHERLLNQWADTYARVLRPRTLIGGYYVADFDGWKDWPTAEHGVLWGGEPIAAILTEYLRLGELRLYVEKMPSLLAARQRFTKEAVSRHATAVDARKRFWNFPGDPKHSNLPPPLLVYADLLATGDASDYFSERPDSAIRKLIGCSRHISLCHMLFFMEH